ncbi:hypothetical protein O9992_21235 [Vibrio lentus]|nr:hypothetical protein [Vibrio lentus]
MMTLSVAKLDLWLTVMTQVSPLVVKGIIRRTPNIDRLERKRQRAVFLTILPPIVFHGSAPILSGTKYIILWCTIRALAALLFV